MAIQVCGIFFQVGGKVIDAESDTDQNGNQSSESSSYYTAVSSSSSEASSRRSSVLVDSLENVKTGIGNLRTTIPVSSHCTSILEHKCDAFLYCEDLGIYGLLQVPLLIKPPFRSPSISTSSGL
jgi:hypothetical protein